MRKVFLLIFVGVFLLVGALTPMVLAIENFNINDFGKTYKLPNISFCTSRDARFISPGDLRVAGCFYFSKCLRGDLW